MSGFYKKQRVNVGCALEGMLRMLVRSALFCVLCLMFGCTVSRGPINHFSSLTINTQQEKFSYKGKGSSAGFMLMSTLGPAGIAVGIAIDEGISKDITKTALAERSLDSGEEGGFQALLADYFQKAVIATANDEAFLKTSNGEQSLLHQYFLDPVVVQTIVVQQAGFLAAPKDQERAVVLIDFQIELSQGPLLISSQAMSDQAEWPSESLDRLKADASAIESLWVQSLAILLKSPAIN